MKTQDTSKKAGSYSRYGAAAAILAMLCLCYAFSLGNVSPISKTSLPSVSAPYSVPPLVARYSNSEYGFSLMMPAGFTPKESLIDGKDTVVLENPSGEGIQILISPYSDAHPLTADVIRKDIPDMIIDNPQPLQVGTGQGGVAFESDNDAFGGSSREVWFVFRGSLYQISTYDRLSPLLRAMFATWQFNVK